MERLRARTAHADLARAGEVAPFAVIVSSSENASSARIRFSGADAQPAIRTVSGRTCDEVVSAAALITALAIEATLSGAPPLPRESADPASPGVLPPDTAASPSEARSRWLHAWGLGATAGIDSWTPGGGYAAGIFGELAARAPLALVRLTLRATTGSASVDERSATFTSQMARLSLCPVSIEIAEPLILFPCAAIDAGRLAAEGDASAALPGPRTAAIFWSAAEAVLVVRWQLGAWMALDVGGELGFPLVRHTFVFEAPNQLVDEVPVVGAGVHAAFALRFH
jgi:hypothetical protein